MRKIVSVSFFIILLVATTFAHENKIINEMCEGPVCLNDKDFKFKDNRLEIYPKDSKYEQIIITEDYGLYVNEKKIHINYKTKKMLKLYYDEVYDIRDQAIAIGIEGAKIGITGAKLGLTAVVSLPMLLFGGTDEFEARMEAVGEEIEAKADRLEDKADGLEDQADKLEDIEDELKDRVEELDDLNWF